MTQCEQVIKYIEDYGSITTMEAFTDLGITRLASRISDLKNAGIDFERKMETRKNRYGKPVSYMRYSFRREQ